jgi:hypothetical protein
MTYPGKASFDAATKHWFVPIYCRTEHGPIVVGDVELGDQEHLVFASSRDEMLTRLRATVGAA